MWWLFLLAFVLLLLLYFWPKGLWLVLGFAVLTLGALIAWNRHLDAERGSIKVEAAYAPARCPGAAPIHVLITNNNERALEKVNFTLHARVPGYSTKATPYTYKQNSSEKILQPGESFASCFTMPPLSRATTETFALEDLEWFGEVDKVFFQ